MRISDWSSNVCSSDVQESLPGIGAEQPLLAQALFRPRHVGRGVGGLHRGDHPQRPEARDVLRGHDLRMLDAPAVVAFRVVAEHAFIRVRSEEHTSELQSLMRISYAVFCLKKKKITTQQHKTNK